MTMDNIESLARMLTNSDDSKGQQILAAANEQTMAEARRIYSDNLSSALAVLSSAMPYEQAYRQLKQLGENPDPGNPLTAAVAGLVPAAAKVVTIKTTQEAHANAARAAVDICLHRARTGSLPATLPAGLPKDPYSGQDFQYERTARGFVLRCQGKDLDKGTIQEFEFTIK